MNPAAFLLYLALGLLALLAPNALITESDVLRETLFTAISLHGIILLLALWCAGTFWWLQSVASREAKDGPLDRLSLWLSLLGVGLLGCVAAWVKPILSIDPLYYIAYGRQITEYGLSPYKVNLWASASDPIIGQINKMWFDNIAFYGPVALSLYTLANLMLAKPTLFGLASCLKALWIPFYGLLGLAVHKLCGPQRRPATMLLAVVANPMMIWFCLVDGHVDLLIITFLLGLAWALEARRPVSAALALAGAASIKIVGIVCFPVAFCWLLASSRKKAAYFLGCFTLVYGALYAPIGGGEYLAIIEFTNQWNNLVAAGVVPRLLELCGLSLPAIRSLSNGVFYLLVGLTCLGVLRGFFKTGPALPMAITMAALFFTRTYYQPWYTLWFWPLLWFAAKDERAYFRSILLWTACVQLIWFVGWPLKIWIIAATAAVNFATALRANLASPIPRGGQE